MFLEPEAWCGRFFFLQTRALIASGLVRSLASTVKYEPGYPFLAPRKIILVLCQPQEAFTYAYYGRESNSHCMASKTTASCRWATVACATLKSVAL